MSEEPVVEDQEITETRHLVIAVHPDGSLEMDEQPFMGWELIGIAAFLDVAGHEQLEEDAEGVE